MTAVLFLGFLLGLQHALEADHLATVASLASRSRTLRGVVRHGMVWGLGHMLTLTAFAGAVILSDRAVDARLASWLELAVGVVLVALGANVLHRLYRERVHFHVHHHGDGLAHLHAHSHAGDPDPHERSLHDHAHPQSFPLRSLFVGMMHGLAGSAALVLLAATALSSAAEGVLYVLLFGLGSMAGMALLSAVIAVPMSLTARLLTWANRLLQGLVGTATVGLGGVIVFEMAADLALLP